MWCTGVSPVFLSYTVDAESPLVLILALSYSCLQLYGNGGTSITLDTHHQSRIIRSGFSLNVLSCGCMQVQVGIHPEYGNLQPFLRMPFGVTWEGEIQE